MMRRGAAAVLAVAAFALPACGGDEPKSNTTRKTTTTRGGDPSSGATPSSPPTNLATTGTTAAAIVGLKLAFPAAGIYEFRDNVTPDDGTKPIDRDTYFTISSPSATVVRVQESSASGVPKSAAYYDERHDRDGLWLVSSATSGGPCDWSNKSASLPQRVIDGGAVTTDATCPTGGSTVRLQVTVTFKTVRDVTVGGRTMRAVDVTRHRVLSQGDTTITSDALDTYALELGLRIATAETTTTRDNQSSRSFTRLLVLKTLPS